MTRYNCKTEKEVSNIDCLEQYRIRPQKIKGNNYWYLSLLRDEKTTSFKVNTWLEPWIDFGNRTGGNLVALGIRMHNCLIEESRVRLNNSNHHFSFHQQSSAMVAFQPENTVIFTAVKEYCRQLVSHSQMHWVFTKDLKISTSVCSTNGQLICNCRSGAKHREERSRGNLASKPFFSLGTGYCFSAYRILYIPAFHRPFSVCKERVNVFAIQKPGYSLRDDPELAPVGRLLYESKRKNSMTATTEYNSLPKRRPPGRPKKTISRSSMLMVRLTPTEKIFIETRAKNAGLKASEWFRRAAKSAKVSPRFTAEESGWCRMLSGLANNLNQLTHLAHVAGLFTLALKCRAILKQVEELLTKISSHDR